MFVNSVLANGNELVDSFREFVEESRLWRIRVEAREVKIEGMYIMKSSRERGKVISYTFH